MFIFGPRISEGPAERKAALERWAAHVRTLATGASAKVLALKKAAMIDPLSAGSIDLRRW